MTLDIGGGTTDIGIWLGGKVLIHSSVLVAADLIARYVRQNSAFMHFLLKQAKLDEGRFLEYWLPAMTSDVNYGCALNYFYRYNDQNKEISQAIIRNAISTPAIRRAVSIAALLLCGVSYYTGMLLASGLKKRADLQKQIEEINVLLCGNGSRLLGWLGEQNAHQAALAKFIRAGMGEQFSKCVVNINQTSQPKLETSLGILQDMKWEGGVPQASVVLGEEGVTINGEKKEPLADLAEIIESGQPSSLVLKIDGDVPVLRKFAKLYNDLADEKGLDSIPKEFSFPSALGHMQQAIFDFSKNPEGVSIPSPFIAGLVAIINSFIGSKK
jgi:hypothetical protein